MHKVIWDQKTVFYYLLKNATFRVKSETMKRVIPFPEMYTFIDITLTYKRLWHITFFLNGVTARVAVPLKDTFPDTAKGILIIHRRILRHHVFNLKDTFPVTITLIQI